MNKEEIEALEKAFITDGWKLFIENITSFQESAVKNAHYDCKTNDEWQFRRGLIHGLNYVLTFQQALEVQNEADI